MRTIGIKTYAILYCFYQVVAFSGDGVYDHCKVTEKLEQKLERKLIFTWDPMHKAALTDTALRSGKKEWSKRFQWLVELTEVIGKGVTYVAWGKSWKEFFDVCQKLQEDPEETFKMSRPAKFSETKFADHAHEVYTKFRNNFKALIIVLEKAKEGSSGSSDEKKKQRKLKRYKEGYTTGCLASLCPWSLMSTRSTAS